MNAPKLTNQSEITVLGTIRYLAKEFKACLTLKIGSSKSKP
jgi:hypothetical protein